MRSLALVPVLVAMLAAAVMQTSTARAEAPGAYLTIPWAIGGERIEADGRRTWFPGEWPTVPVAGMRIWDARTAWLNIEMTPGDYSFARLDAYVAKAEARGVREIVLVLGGTPRWAAAQVRPTDAPWMGPGSASPPASLTSWRSFVGAVATRYRGRIAAYEIWNEPDNPTYWSGSVGQWAALVRSASAEILAVDPLAQIIASGFRVGACGWVGDLRPWLRGLKGVPGLSALSLHWYPHPGFRGCSLASSVSSVRSMARAYGLPTRVWVTEMNVQGGAALPRADQRRTAKALMEFVSAADVDRAYWYAWTDLDPSGLLPLQPGTPAARVAAGG